MKEKKIKTYVLTLSQTFPTTHPRKGEPTHFFKQFWDEDKIHTIRGNYELWAKRIEEIKDGKAVLSIRQWTGKPYNSPQKEEWRMDSRSKIGVQKVLLWDKDSPSFDPTIIHPMYPQSVKVKLLAKNDGLSLEDFKAWFKGSDLSKPMAIIHFTSFRY